MTAWTTVTIVAPAAVFAPPSDGRDCHLQRGEQHRVKRSN
jgi:hypothetical protein